MISETTQSDVDKLISKIYRDAIVKKSTKQFITLQYTPSSFPTKMHMIVQRVLSFLPNTNYLGKPFIMSVSYNKGTQDYEIIVKNPNI